MTITIKQTKISIACLFFMMIVNIYCFSEEPKTFQELVDHLDKFSNSGKEEQFVFYILKDYSTYLANTRILQNFGKIESIWLGVGESKYLYGNVLVGTQQQGSYINLFVTHSRKQSEDLFFKALNNDFVYSCFDSRIHTSNVFFGLQSQETIPRFFLSPQWLNEEIGNVSYDRRFGGFEGHATYETGFIRSNIFFLAFLPKDDLFSVQKIKLQDKFFAMQDIKKPLSPDPREIAWRIDRYLKGDPLVKFSEEEKQKIKTLEITLPKEIEFEQGKEYPLDFPRKSPDGTVPAEIRLVVSRSEIQQIVDTNVAKDKTVFPNPASFAPDIDGKYTVLFGQPEKQTINCYHINEEGKCLAWGEIEVVVKKTETPIQQENEKMNEQVNENKLLFYNHDISNIILVGQNNNNSVDSKLEKMIQTENEERKNNIKWYGSKENWKDVKFLSEYFGIDLTRKGKFVRHKRPVFTEKDFEGISSNIIFKNFENENHDKPIPFTSDKKYLYCDTGDNFSLRYYFECKNVPVTKATPFFMTVWYLPTNEDAVRAVFDKLTYRNSMGVHQMLQNKRITVSNKYNFGEICFTLPSPEVENNEKRLTFFFIRDGVVFRIERSYEADFDSVGFVKYIDNKYVELNRKLNPELKDYQ